MLLASHLACPTGLGSLTVLPLPARSAPALPPTGERTAPGLPDEEYWFARHEVAYAWITRRFAELISAGIVADAGAGEGYGTAWLREADPRSVIAWEYDEAACLHATRTYPETAMVRANLDALPARDSTIDLIACCQVIEHLWDLPRFLRECSRVLRPGGALIVTTPNRLTFSPGLGRCAKPVNPFHVEEFDAEQVGSLMRAAGFVGIEVLGLDHADRIDAWEQDNGSIVAAQVAAVLGDHLPPDLRDFIRTVNRDDFTVGSASDSAADLIGIGFAP
ncbi:MAG: class I SAM-dependent methyltransferase [Actinobacteria bacterium]|nr:class I SAM-dependent methyltransferase [Actinomycetota bacterium]